MLNAKAAFAELGNLGLNQGVALFKAVTGPHQQQGNRQEQQLTEMDDETIELRRREFSQPYMQPYSDQDIPKQLEEYVGKCWERYCNAKATNNLVFTDTTIVQSSGFGKSRQLRELAERTQAADSRIKVLYVCIREGESSGYPLRTNKWPEYLFEAVNDKKPDEKLERGFELPP